MKTIAALLLFIAAPVLAATGPYGGEHIDTNQGIVVSTQPGTVCLSASSDTVDTCKILLDGRSGDITSKQIQDLEARPTGHAVKLGGVLQPVVSTFNFTGGITITKVGDQFNIDVSTLGDSYRYVSTTLGVVTGGNPTWESIAGSTLPLVMDSSQYVDITLSCNIECVDYTHCGVAFGLLVDGEYGPSVTSSTDTGIMYFKTTAPIPESPQPLIFQHKTQTKLAAGSHELSLIWATDQGVTVRMGRNMNGCSLVYSESPELLGFASESTVSGQTNLGSQTTTALASLSCDVPPCTAQTTDIIGLWVAVPPYGAGDWINVYNGLGP